ncbi:MAG: YkvA family protein [Caulobacteraceae bacterium]
MKTSENDIFEVIKKLPKYSKLVYKLYRSKETGKKQKLLLSLGIAYSISPIDLIPGIIPVAGQLDNLLIMLRCLEKALNSMDAATSKKYLSEAGITMDEIREDIEISRETLKATGRGAVRLAANTAKFIGYSTLYTAKKLWKKKPY